MQSAECRAFQFQTPENARNSYDGRVVRLSHQLIMSLTTVRNQQLHGSIPMFFHRGAPRPILGTPIIGVATAPMVEPPAFSLASWTGESAKNGKTI